MPITPAALTQAEYFRHELLDRTSMLMDMVEAHLMVHPALADATNPAFTHKQRAKIRNEVEKAAGALFRAYQIVGEIHL